MLDPICGGSGVRHGVDVEREAECASLMGCERRQVGVANMGAGCERLPALRKGVGTVVTRSGGSTGG
jgi:hypothetical protein